MVENTQNPDESSKDSKETPSLSVSIMDLKETHEFVENLSQTAKKVEEQLESIQITKNAINKIVETKQGSKILAPLADGIFIKASLDEDKTFLVNIGAGKTAEKSASQVIDMICRHEQNLTDQMASLDKQIESHGTKLIEMMQDYESNPKK